MGIRGRLAAWGPPAVTLVLFIGLWYLVSSVLLDTDRRFLLPPPDAVVRVAFLDGENRAPLLSALLLSTEVALLGLAIATLLGLALGIAMSQARWVERSLYPYAVILQCIPTLALVPVIGFWFDFGWTSRLIVTVTIALFPVISSTLFGLQSADPGQHDLFTLHGAGRWTRLVKLQAPAALPAFFVSLRNAAGLAVIGAIVGDFVFGRGEPGIGERLRAYFSRINNEALFGAIILSTLLGISFYLLFDWIGRRAIGRWHGARER